MFLSQLATKSLVLLFGAYLTADMASVGFCASSNRPSIESLLAFFFFWGGSIMVGTAMISEGVSSEALVVGWRTYLSFWRRYKFCLLVKALLTAIHLSCW
jgi:hypothetical protein